MPTIPLNASRRIKGLRRAGWILAQDGFAEPRHTVPILVCIDTERTSRPPYGSLSEIGVSVVDPVDIDLARGTDGYPPGSSDHFEYIIHHLLAHKHILVRGSYASRNRARSNFVDPVCLPIAQVQEGLAAFVDEQRVRNTAPGTERPVVLVGYGLNGDFEILQQLVAGDYLDSLYRGYIDVSWEARISFQLVRRCSLRDCLEWLRLEFRGLHNASNDAAYTMWVLVYMLYVLNGD